MIVEDGCPSTETAEALVVAPNGHLSCEGEGLEWGTHTGPLVAVDDSETPCPIIETCVGWVEQQWVGIHLGEMNVLRPQMGEGEQQ